VPVAVEHPRRIEESHSPSEPEPEEPQNHHAVELSREEEVHELPSHIPEQAENHIEEDEALVEHHERDVHLENGHAHIVDEVLEGADGSRTHRIIEDAEYENENGMKVHVHKTTESTEVTSTTIITTPNGDGADGEEHNGDHE